MAEGLLAFLDRDLREALEVGFQRTPAVIPGGERWLIRWVLISTLIGLTLFLFCGYHGGFSRLNTMAAQIPEWIWQWLTVLGDERVAFALSLFLTRRYPRVFWTLVTAALLGMAFTLSLKPLISALRPPAVLEAGTFSLIGPGYQNKSFPSGHTVTAAIFFGVCVYYVRASWLRLSLILLAVAVGLSRVAVGVHWPVDVAGGLAGGTAAVWLGVRLLFRGGTLGMDLSIHLAFVTLAVVMAGSLFLGDGGYRAAADMQRVLGISALGYTALAYLALPVLRFFALRSSAG